MQQTSGSAGNWPQLDMYVVDALEEAVPANDERRSLLVLVSGWSRAGRSTFVCQLCETTAGAQHLPLDHYFLAVPPGQRFIDRVQSPTSIDWATLRADLAQLSSGQSCYTPCLELRQARSIAKREES